MAGSSPKPTCTVSNNVCVDESTSSLMYSPAPCATGRPASYPPEHLWAELVNDPPFTAQDKIFTLSHHLHLFARLQGNVDLTPAQINPQALANPDAYEAYAERMQLRNEWVHAIAQSRMIVRGLSAFELNLSADQLEELKTYLNRRLLEAAPYYTQMANMNLLADKSKAWTRTCNLTTLSMSLEALGIGPDDFKGNPTRLQRIADTLEAWRYKNFDKKDRGVGAYCISDIKTMRMPDLLQFSAVYALLDIQIDDLTGAAYLKKIEEARDQAAKKVTTYEMITKIAGLFGAKCSKVQAIHSFGEEKIGHEKRIDQLNKTMKNLKDQLGTIQGGAQAEAKLNAFSQAHDDEATEESKLTDLNKQYAQPGRMDQGVKAYQKLILQKIGPELDKGNQIFLHKPGVVSGHYMKLHDIDRAGGSGIGVYIDDPWNPGKRSPLTWQEAYEKGYFDSYMVISK